MPTSRQLSSLGEVEPVPDRGGRSNAHIRSRGTSVRLAHEAAESRTVRRSRFAEGERALGTCPRRPSRRASRFRREPLQAVFAESEANAIQARLFHELALILGERWDKIPDKKRPLYTPEQRYRILRIRRLLALSAGETARLFRVSPSTISRWESEGSGASEDERIKPLVRTAPPVRRYADVVRQLVHSMKLAGFGGYETIAQTLAHAGWKLSKRTVGRILREQPPSGNPTEAEAPKASTVVLPRYPNHIAFIDITEVPGLFGLWRFKFAVVAGWLLSLSTRRAALVRVENLRATVACQGFV